MADFMFHLDWAKDAQIAGKSSLLTVSRRVLQEDISIWIGRLSTDWCLHQCGHCHPIHQEPKWNKKVEERPTHSFCLNRDTQFLLPSHISSPVFQSLDSDWNTPQAFLVLQLADDRLTDCRTSQPLSSCEPIPIMHIYKISYWFHFSEESWIIHLPWQQ